MDSDLESGGKAWRDEEARQDLGKGLDHRELLRMFSGEFPRWRGIGYPLAARDEANLRLWFRTILCVAGYPDEPSRRTRERVAWAITTHLYWHLPFKKRPSVGVYDRLTQTGFVSKTDHSTGSSSAKRARPVRRFSTHFGKPGEDVLLFDPDTGEIL